MTAAAARRRDRGAASPALSAREIACLDAYRRGMTYRAIAGELGVSEKTVDSYLASARRKLGARTTAQAADIARDLRLIA
jgi:DNA-binding CsgD family transcriptional regulator